MDATLNEGDGLARRQREAEVGVLARADVVTVEAPATREAARGDAQDDVHVGEPHRHTHLRRPVDAAREGDAQRLNEDGGNTYSNNW